MKQNNGNELGRLMSFENAQNRFYNPVHCCCNLIQFNFICIAQSLNYNCLHGLHILYNPTPSDLWPSVQVRKNWPKTLVTTERGTPLPGADRPVWAEWEKNSDCPPCLSQDRQLQIGWHQTSGREVELGGQKGGSLMFLVINSFSAVCVTKQFLFMVDLFLEETQNISPF